MTIVAVKRNSDGDNEQFKLDDGQIIDLNLAIQMCKDGQLEGFNVGTSKSGTEYIRGNADGESSNNLDNMPTF